VSTGHAYRAFETTDDTGTGTFKDLDGPVTGFQEIVGALKNITGQGTGPWTAEITIENVTLGGGDWEAWEVSVEEGTGVGGKDRVKFDTGTLKESSNSDAPVVWGSGIKNVFIAPSAKKGYALFDALTTAGLIERVTAESYAIVAISTYIKTLLDDADATTARATLGAVIGTNVQAWDADLDAIAALAKTSGNVIRGNGSAWTSAVLASADVSHTPVSPLTGATVNDAIDQLSHALSSVTSQATANTNFSAEVAVTDLAGLTIPGSPDSAKRYRVVAKVTIGAAAAGGVNVIVRLRVGSAGTIADAEVDRVYDYHSALSANIHTILLVSKPFVPASGNKVTISVEDIIGANNPDTVITYTDCYIEQLRNA